MAGQVRRRGSEAYAGSYGSDGLGSPVKSVLPGRSRDPSLSRDTAPPRRKTTAEKEDDRQAVVAAGVEKHANDCADDGDTRIQRYVEPAPRPLCHSVILRSPRAARPLAMPHMCRSGRAIGGRLRRGLAGGTSGHSAGTDPRSGQAVSLPSTDLPNWLPVNRPTARIVDAARVAVAVDAPRSLQRSMSAEPRRGPPPHRRQGR